MQGVCKSDVGNRNLVFVESKTRFLLCSLFVLAASAAISCFAPIAFSVVTVFLFAGPHNWVELRYFLSRLPSRFGPLRAFFLSSFTGVLLLGVGYAGLIMLARGHLFAYEQAILCFQIWIASLHAWLSCLIFTRGKSSLTEPASDAGLTESIAPRPNARLGRKGIALSCLFVSVLVSLQYPLYFGLALVYLHPMIGLWILERELRRSRPGWLRPYHAVLTCTVIVLAGMIFGLAGQASFAGNNKLVDQISRHAGSFLLPDLSTYLLVSVHTFLEMLHYAVWLVAIPIATRAWQQNRWQPASMPVSRGSSLMRKIIPVVFLGSTVLVLALWAAFLGDYSATRDLYFTVAVFHILAELPFLLWML